MTELKLENNLVKYDNVGAYIFIITTPRFNKLGLFRLGKYDNPEDIKLLNIKEIDLKLDDQFIMYAYPCPDALIDFKYKLLYKIFQHFNPVEDELNSKSLEVFNMTDSKNWFIFDYKDLKIIIEKTCSFEGPIANFEKFVIKIFNDIRKKHEEDILNMIRE